MIRVPPEKQRTVIGIDDFVIEDLVEDLEAQAPTGSPGGKSQAKLEIETPEQRARTASSNVDVVKAFKGDRRTLRAFLYACDTIIEEDAIQVSAELKAWFDEIRKAAQEVPFTVLKWPLAIVLSLTALAFAGSITWFVTLEPLPTTFMGLGLFSGVLGVAKVNAELAAIGGVLAKTLAWYLAPTLETLNMVEKYVLSIMLAAFLEYPFLTFANTISIKRKTAMGLRTLQDAVDVVASFIMVALSGIGLVDAFTVSQTVLALVRVAVATLGPMYCLPAHARDTVEKPKSSLTVEERRRHLETAVNLYGKVSIDTTNPEFDDWFEARNQELSRLPHLSSFDRLKGYMDKSALVCIGLTILGVGLGAFGFTLETDFYLLGIAAVLGMGLAWYVGPSLKDRKFLFKWAVSILLSATLEYPFLSTANVRAAATHMTFELRAVQDMAGMVVSTLLIVILSNVRLNRIDFAQLAIGALRLVVVTRFFWTM